MFSCETTGIPNEIEERFLDTIYASVFYHRGNESGFLSSENIMRDV